MSEVERGGAQIISLESEILEPNSDNNYLKVNVSSVKTQTKEVEPDSFLKVCDMKSWIVEEKLMIKQIKCPRQSEELKEGERAGA